MSATPGGAGPGRGNGLDVPWRVAAATVAAVAALLAAPSGAAAATTCDMAGAALEVMMSASDDKATLFVEAGGTEILVGAGLDFVTCAGGTPTVNNIDAISVRNQPGGTNNEVGVAEASRFAPGKTAESGDDEIEIFVNLNGGAGSALAVGTAPAGGAMVFGTSGINTNATGAEVEPDRDIVDTNVPALGGFGRSGQDFISAQGGAGTGNPLPVPISLSGEEGNDVLVGGEGDDPIHGGTGGDNLVGRRGNDTIDGGPGTTTNVLSGDAGNDRLLPSSAADSAAGGDGVDGLDYSVNLTTGVSVDMDVDPVVEIETVVGTNFDDTLRGDDAPNTLVGLQANDVLEGRGGNDTLQGVQGDDSLDVRDGGPDTADCGSDTDTVTADSPGTDALFACENVLFPAIPVTPGPDPGPSTAAPLPSNEFSFGKLKKNKAKGTAELTVIVPGPGEVDLAETKKVKPQEERAEGEGEVKLAIKPSRRSKQRLGEKGRAKVSAEVTYTPDGGEANTQSKTVKLIKK
jgi:hypothetical protein